jgi:hypothetical protein
MFPRLAEIEAADRPRRAQGQGRPGGVTFGAAPVESNPSWTVSRSIEIVATSWITFTARY